MTRIAAALTITNCLLLSPGTARAQEPAYATGQGPVVLIDLAHHNAWGAEAQASMIRFLEDDGYQVRKLEVPFGSDILDSAQIAFIIGALSAQNALPDGFTQEEFEQAWRLPTPSAFSEDEVTILAEWVAAGGSVLLVLDHMPLAGAAQDLAAAFDIQVSNGYAVDPNLLTGVSPPSVAQAGSVVFRRSDGTLVEHPITSGRNVAERVDSAAMYVGSAIRLPSSASSLLTLGPTFVSLLPSVAWVFSDTTLREPVGGWSQGGVLRVGDGRLAIFGEHGILATPELVAADAANVGNNPQVQNPQLLLNALHWLSGLLDEE